MMVPPVFAFTTVSFGQFNSAIFNAIDGSDVNTIAPITSICSFIANSDIQISLPLCQTGGR
jgi:hypothetical protein